MEHRCGTRYPTDTVVCVGASYGALIAPGLLTDVSVSGCFIHTLLPVDPLVRISVRILSARRSLANLRLDGQVTRRTKSGIGVEWAEYLPELVRQLTWYPRLDLLDAWN